MVLCPIYAAMAGVCTLAGMESSIAAMGAVV
jgi:hypothetical protein